MIRLYEKMTNIFAYGTLMIPAIFRAVCGQVFPSEKAVLSGYVRYRVKNEDYPGIIACPGDRVEGIVYYDLDDASVERLDLFENVYFYHRNAVSLEVENEIVAAETYEIRPECRDVLSNEAWDPESFKKHHQQAYLNPDSNFW